MLSPLAEQRNWATLPCVRMLYPVSCSTPGFLASALHPASRGQYHRPRALTYCSSFFTLSSYWPYYIVR